MNAFTYTSLSSERDEIRVLTLSAGKPGDRPRANIEVMKLGDGDYVALSYVWGSEEDRRDILIGETTVSITANLAIALDYLQRKGPLRLWIDALCINQDDAPEKISQISLMSRIYSSASCTYIWLGEAVYYSDVALDVIRRIKDTPMSSWANRHLFAVEQILRRPYWTRAWVVQEAFCSTNAIVKCGEVEISFDAFYHLPEFTSFNRARPQTDRCPENPAQTVLRFQAFPFELLLKLCRQERGKKTISLDLFRWLNYGSELASKLPRDRIFAFLNLAFESDKRAIEVDYTVKTDRRVFSEVTAHLVKTRSPYKHLLPLQVRQIGKRLDLPSWCPDWTTRSQHGYIVPPAYRTEYCAGQNDFWKKFSPLGQGSRNDRMQLRFSDDFETLVLRGFVFDSISYAIASLDTDMLVHQPDYYWKMSWKDLHLRVTKSIQSWEGELRSSNVYGPSISEAIAQTVVANEYPSTVSPPRNDCAAKYEQWKQVASPTNEDKDDVNFYEFEYRVRDACALRALCITQKGYIGLTPSTTAKGDLVCLFPDGQVPFVLRKKGPFYEWIGEAYIHGIMYGEGLSEISSMETTMFDVR